MILDRVAQSHYNMNYRAAQCHFGKMFNVRVKKVILEMLLEVQIAMVH